MFEFSKFSSFTALAKDDDDDDDWRKNLKKHSETLTTVDEVDSLMETDQITENQNEMSEDERQINKILHESKEPNTSEEQDPLAKSLNLDWCNISRPRLPYAEFLNETVNNGKYSFLNLIPWELFFSYLVPWENIFFEI